MSYKIPETISESIYDYLKQDIIDGKLRQNERMREREIASFFNVSTTPVREAFKMLAAEGYLKINPRKDVVVADVTLKTMSELFQVVRVLDTYAIMQSLEKISDENIGAITKMTYKLGQYIENRKISGYVKQNLSIHEALWKTADNEFLYQSLKTLAERSIFFSNRFFSVANNLVHLNKSYKDHLDIAKALKSRDSIGLNSVLAAHWGREILDISEGMEKSS